MQVDRRSRAEPDRKRLLLLLLGAAALRVLVQAMQEQPGIDNALVHSYGLSWLRTGSYSGIQWPISWPLLSGSLSLLVGARASWGLIFVLGTTALLWPLHGGLRSLFGRRAAFFGCATVAALPACSAVIVKSGSHCLYLPLFALGFRLHVACLARGGWGRELGLGAVLGLAYVTRTDGFVYIIAVAASFALLPQRAWRDRVRRSLLVLLGAAVFVLPNVWHVKQHTGSLQLSAHLGRMLDSPQYIGGLGDPGLEAIREQSRRGPAYYLRMGAYHARLFAGSLPDLYVLPFPLLLLLGFGLPVLIGRRLGPGALLLVLWALPPLAFLAVQLEDRYLAPMALFLAAGTGPAWELLFERLGERRRSVAALLFAGGLAGLVACTLATAMHARDMESGDPATQALRLREHLGEDLAVTYGGGPAALLRRWRPRVPAESSRRPTR